MTKEEIARISITHVLKQGKPSYRDGTCWYRRKGLMCAAGPFIEEYDQDMEGNSWDNLCEYFEENLNSAAVQHKGFVYMLQDCHDAAAQDFNDSTEDFLTDYKNRIRRHLSRESINPSLVDEIEKEVANEARN